MKMTDETKADLSRLGLGKQPISEQTHREIELCKAMDRLAPALIALRLTLDAADKAPEMLCISREDTTPDDALELRRRWAAASLILNDAVAKVEGTGAGIIAAVKTLLVL